MVTRFTLEDSDHRAEVEMSDAPEFSVKLYDDVNPFSSLTRFTCRTKPVEVNHRPEKETFTEN